MAQVALAQGRVTTPNRPQKITVGEMREAGVRHRDGRSGTRLPGSL